MNAASALARLRAFGKPVVTTDDAALALGAERSAATHTLKRLAAAGLLKRIRHGLWTKIDSLSKTPVDRFLIALHEGDVEQRLTASARASASGRQKKVLSGALTTPPLREYIR